MYMSKVNEMCNYAEAAQLVSDWLGHLCFCTLKVGRLTYLHVNCADIQSTLLLGSLWMPFLKIVCSEF